MTTNPLYLMLSTIENAAVAELVDALDLKSNWYLNASAGSSPARGTSRTLCRKISCEGFFYVKQTAGREACPAEGK